MKFAGVTILIRQQYDMLVLYLRTINIIQEACHINSFYEFI